MNKEIMITPETTPIASTITGKCYCGAVKWISESPMLWSAICHCEDCRRAASSDYVSWFGVRREATEWQGPRKLYASSQRVTRSFCGVCGSPTSFETQIFPKETHLYAATLDKPSLYHPTAHIYWSERLKHLQVIDQLPKYSKGLQFAAENGLELS
jgi:hypothetical protein